MLAVNDRLLQISELAADSINQSSSISVLEGQGNSTFADIVADTAFKDQLKSHLRESGAVLLRSIPIADTAQAE